MCNMRKEINLSMEFDDYKYFYLNFVDRLLGIREQEFDCMNITEEKKQSFFNYALGAKLLLMVAFIESNFLSKSQMKSLRKFEQIEGIPDSINQSILSCFIYIRDAIAHNPRVELLPPGYNTDAFVRAVDECNFHFAKIDNSTIKIEYNAIHCLHLMVRNFYNFYEL